MPPAGGDEIRPLSISPWQFAHTSTHFFASARSLASRLPGAPRSCVNDFRRRVNMMEVQVDDAAVVAADGAAPTCLRDKDALDLLETSRHSLTTQRLQRQRYPRLPCAVAMEHDQAMAPAVAQCRGAVSRRRTATLFEQRGRRFGWHEHMFAITSDGEAAIIERRAVSSMAERGTSTQKGALVGKPLVGRQLCAGTPLEPRVPKRDNPEDWAISRQPRQGEPSEAIRCPP